MSMLEALLGRIAGAVVQGGIAAYRANRADTRELEAALKLCVANTQRDRHLSHLLGTARKDIANILKESVGSEFRTHELAEWTPAAEAVERTLLAVDLSTANVINDALDEKVFARRYEPARAQVLASAGLSEAGTEFYDRLLSASVECLVAFIAELPSTKKHERAHSLLSLHEILEHARRQDARQVAAEAEQSLRIVRLREAYARAIEQRCSTTQIFGIDLVADDRKLPLATAWAGVRASFRTTATGRRQRDQEPERQDVDVDKLLLLERHILLEADAGYGKTTVLNRWALQHSTPESATVPFLVPLRKVHRSLPSVRGLIGAAAPHLRDSVPEDWTEAQLVEGNALLLVDGMDEVPRDLRGDVIAWVEGLRASFPLTRIVVTSRPTENLAKEMPAFSNYVIEPLSIPEIGVFSDNWHRARSSTDPDRAKDDPDLTEESHSFKRLVGSNESLHRLASCPLLCAIMCGMHHDRPSSMPRSRMGIYQQMINTLVWRREAERESGGEADGVEPDIRMVLLRDLAYWMLSNEYLDVPKKEAVDRIKRKSYSVSLDPNDAERTYRLLVERTGIIREETIGHASFIHRTFQEYLAAEEMMLDDRPQEVIRLARNENMREFVVLAAGHANRQQRSTIIGGLVEPADRDKSQRKRYRALAIACQETSTEITSSLRKKLREATDELTPPRNERQASDLVRALGGEAVPLLQHWQQEDARTVSSVIYGLGLVGSHAALMAIAAYGDDSRAQVVRALVRAWRLFDEQEYAREVLRRTPLHRANVMLSASQLDAIHSANDTARELWTHGEPGSYAGSRHGALARVRRIHLRLPPEDTKATRIGIDVLSQQLVGLDEFGIHGQSNVDLTSLGELSIDRLVLGDLGKSWYRLPVFRNASVVELRDPPDLVQSETHFPNAHSLTVVALRNSFTANLPSLRGVKVIGQSRSAQLVIPEQVQTLERVEAKNSPVRFLAAQPVLKELELESSWLIGSDVSRLIPGVTSAIFRDVSVLDFDVLPWGLRTLHIVGADRIENVERILDLPQLNQVSGLQIRATREQRRVFSEFAKREWAEGRESDRKFPADVRSLDSPRLVSLKVVFI